MNKKENSKKKKEISDKNGTVVIDTLFLNKKKSVENLQNIDAYN